MDQKIYVQIENKSLIPFFDLEKDSFREINLTTIKDNQRTAIVTLYTRDAAGLNVQRKQYTIKPIPKGKAGTPKIGLSTRKRGYRRVDIELSLNGKQIVTDRLKLPGAARPIVLVLLILLLAALLGFGGYLIFTSLRADTAQTPPTKTQVSRTPSAGTKEASPPTLATPELSVTQEEQTRDPQASVQAPASEPPVTKPETSTPRAIPVQTFQQLLYFTPDSADLSQKTTEALDTLISELQGFTDAEISITGHCAPHGTEKGRQELSELRAERVAEYLQKSGINMDKADIYGAGAREPITLEKEKQHLNRRVEIIIETEE